MHNTLQQMEKAFLMWIQFGGEQVALNLLFQLLEDKQHFFEEDCNIPKFSHDIWNIRVLNFLNELSK